MATAGWLLRKQEHSREHFKILGCVAPVVLCAVECEIADLWERQRGGGTAR